jgi:hypothetical protein
MEITGVIKGCDILCVFKNWQTLAALWAGILLCNKKKILDSRKQLDEPVECASAGDPLPFIKFCIYCFSLWYEFFMHCALRVEKKL